MNKETLNSLGLHHKTDKSSKSHNYLVFYEHFFAHFRNDPIDILEIGLFQGGSAMMLLDYFPNAIIHGVDIRPERVATVKNERFKGYVADHGDLRSIVSLVSSLSPTILIDDGSHFWEHQLVTLDHLGPLVDPKGLVVLEDLHVNYPPKDVDFSRGIETRPVDKIMQMSDSILSGGLSAQSCTDLTTKYASKNYSSITHYRHTIIACRPLYYTRYLE